MSNIYNLTEIKFKRVLSPFRKILSPNLYKFTKDVINVV